MSAEEVLAQHQWDVQKCSCGTEHPCGLDGTAVDQWLAAHQVDALKAAGCLLPKSISWLRTKAHIERQFARRAELGEPDVPRHPEFYRGRAEAYQATADAAEAQP